MRDDRSDDGESAVSDVAARCGDGKSPQSFLFRQYESSLGGCLGPTTVPSVPELQIICLPYTHHFLSAMVIDQRASYCTEHYFLFIS